MAGAGYKLFNTGDVLTAAQVNTYLMQQTVMVFADSTARTTALSGVLAEGMLSYLANTNAVEVYDGSSWVAVSNTGDITGVTAGTGLSGGGTSGSVTVSIDTAVTADLSTAQTLTNKTLTAPVVSSISNTGTLTLPTSTDTLVGRATTDTLTNKTITTPVISIGLNAQTASYTLQASDRNKLVTITSSLTANFTVPSGVFSAGDVVYIARLGTGAVAAVASGTTINGTPGLNLRAQYSTSAIICTASNTFLLVGDLAL